LLDHFSSADDSRVVFDAREVKNVKCNEREFDEKQKSIKNESG